MALLAGSGITTEGSKVHFDLTGLPAAVFFILFFGYFIVFNRFLGGTIWRRILGVPPTA